MQALNAIREIESWCATAKPGDSEDFCVSGGIEQAEASKLAGELNVARSDHIWIEVREVAFVPNLVTTIHVRCSH